jgi:hypothetical protein
MEMEAEFNGEDSKHAGGKIHSFPQTKRQEEEKKRGTGAAMFRKPLNNLAGCETQ